MLWSSASIEVRQAAAQCVKNILAAQSGVDFWEQHKNNRDPMLTYLNPFRKAKKKVGRTFLCVQYVCVPMNKKINSFFTPRLRLNVVPD